MPVGVLDSGVGGLSVLRAIRATQPSADLIYYADQAHLPYGPRPAAEIRHLTETGVDWLLAINGAQIVQASASFDPCQGLLLRLFSVITPDESACFPLFSFAMYKTGCCRFASLSFPLQ